MGFLLCKSMLITRSHHLLLHVFGTDFQVYLFLHLPRGQCEAGQSMFPRSFFLPYLKMALAFSFLQSKISQLKSKKAHLHGADQK